MPRFGGWKLEPHRVRCLHLRQGETLAADWYISAVPFDRLLDLLPAKLIEEHAYFNHLRHLETSPITSVHLWYDRPVMKLPHVVLVECVGQWVFNRCEVQPGEHYVQVVVSAARQFRGLGREEVQRQIVEEMAKLFPDARPQALIAGASRHRACGDLQRGAGRRSLAAEAAFADRKPAGGRRLDRNRLAGDDGRGGTQRLPGRGSLAKEGKSGGNTGSGRPVIAGRRKA